MSESLSANQEDSHRQLSTARVCASIGPVVFESHDGSASFWRKEDGVLVPLPADPIERLNVLDNLEDKDGGFYA